MLPASTEICRCSTTLDPASFSPYTLSSGLELKKPRRDGSDGRADAPRNASLVPTEIHVEYYRQRASAGLIITEAAWVSPEAIGFIKRPRHLFSADQVEGWKKVTEAVHAEGGAHLPAGRAFWRRIPSRLSSPASRRSPPSAVNPGLRSFTNEGFKETVTAARDGRSTRSSRRSKTTRSPRRTPRPPASTASNCIRPRPICCRSFLNSRLKRTDRCVRRQRRETAAGS